MTALPDKNDLVSALTTEAAFQGALSDLYDYVAEIFVAATPESNPIALGAVTPTSTILILDTEDDLSTDDLTNIAPINIGAKMIMLRCESASRIITLKQMAGGTGQMDFYAGVDVVLDNPDKLIVLQYDPDTSVWGEVFRNWGVFAPSNADKSATRAALGLGNANIWTGTATGTGTSHTVTTGGNLQSYTGIELSYSCPVNVTGPLVVNVDGLGVKAWKRNGQDLVNGDILAGDAMRGYYNGTNFESLLPVRISDSNSTGDIIGTFASTPRAGYIFIQGQTLGKDGSGATLAGVTYQALYQHLWTNVPSLAVSGGRGASASADFAAGKVLTMMDSRNGKSLVGAGTGFTTGTTGGSATKTLVAGNLPSHFHLAGGLTASSAGAHAHENGLRRVPGQDWYGSNGDNGTDGVGPVAAGNSSGLTRGKPLTSTAGDHTHSITGQTANYGDGTAFDVMNPWLAINWMIKL